MRRFLEAKVIVNTRDMSKDEWLEHRRCGIGGSDAAAIVGMNPFKSMVSVYVDKLKLEEDEAKSSFRMEMGSKLEDFVAREFSLRTGKKTRNVNGILRNDKYPFAIANIDKRVCKEKAVLECVVTNSYCKKEWERAVPIQYQIQCLHYMAVTGATHAYVAALVGNEELFIHRLERDEDMIEYVMAEEEKFWKECIIGGNVPLPDGSEEYSRFLKSRYKDSREDSLILFMQEEKLSRYDEVCSCIKKLDVEKKLLEQGFQKEMGEYEIAFVGDRKISWKKQSRSSVDTKKLREDYPEIVEGYVKTTNTRVFKVS